MRAQTDSPGGEQHNDNSRPEKKLRNGGIKFTPTEADGWSEVTVTVN